MLGVCFRSEHRGWMQDQWSFVFSNFGITDIWERGKTDESSIYQTTIGIDTAIELPDRPIVVLAPPDGKYIQGVSPLQEFTHPEDAIYLFGGSQEVLNDEEDLGGRVPDHLVYVPLVQYEMYSHSTAYITLWDRYVKRGAHG